MKNAIFTFFYFQVSNLSY